MGNEMGNSNVSGLQEEDNKTVEPAEKSSREAAYDDNVKEENQVVPAVEDKDFHEKITGLSSNEGNHIVPAVKEKDFREKSTGLSSDEGNLTVPAVQDKDVHEKVAGLASDASQEAGYPCTDYQISDGMEQDASDVQPFAGSPEVLVDSKDGDAFSRHELASLSADDEDNEKSIKSILEEKLLEKSESSMKRLTSSEKDKEETSSTCTNSPPHSAEHLEYIDQELDRHELDKIHAEPSVENCRQSVQGRKETLALSLSCDVQVKGHSDTEIASSLAESVGSDTNPEVEKKMEELQGEEMASREEQVSDTSICEEKSEIRGGDDDDAADSSSKVSTTSNSLNSWEENGDGELPVEMNLIRNGSSHLQQEAIKGNNCNGGLPVEMNLIRNDSWDSQEEAIKGDNSGGGLAVEMNSIRNGSLGLQSEHMNGNNCNGGLPVEMNSIQQEAILVINSLNSFHEVAKPEDKCMDITEEKKLIGYESESEDPCPTQFFEQLGSQTNTNMSDGSYSRPDNNGKESVVDSSSDPTMDNDFEVEEAKVLDNADNDSIPNSNLKELCKDSEEGAEKILEMASVPTECAMDKDFKVEEAKVLDHADLDTIPNSNLKELCGDSEGGAENIFEMASVPTESAVDKDFTVEKAKVLDNADNDSIPNSNLKELCKDSEEGAEKILEMASVPTECAMDKDFEVEEAKVLDNADNDSIPNSNLKELCRDSEEGAEIIFEMASVPTESAVDKGFRVEKVKVLDNADNDNIPNSNFKEFCKDSEEEAEKIPEMGSVPTESVMEAKVLDNADNDGRPNSNLKEPCKDLEGAEKIPEMASVPTEVIVTDCSHEGDEPIEKNMVEEILEKTEYPHVVENGIQETETVQCVLESYPIGQTVNLLSPTPVSPLQSQEHKQDTAMEYEIFEDMNQSTMELSQNGNGELSLTKASNLDVIDLTTESLVLAVELADNKLVQEFQQNSKRTSMAVSQIETADQSKEECRKNETPAFANGSYEAQDIVGRFSTESNSENLSIQSGIRKSPSFHFELLSEAGTEESDQTPLLYQDKTVTGNLSKGIDVSFRNPVGDHGQDSVQYQAIPVEEESSKLEKSDSEKSRTPFLSFLKEEEEARLLATPQNQDTVVSEKKAAKEVWKSPDEEVTSTSTKRRTKRRSRSSLFSNCICCATAIS